MTVFQTISIAFIPMVLDPGQGFVIFIVVASLYIFALIIFYLIPFVISFYHALSNGKLILLLTGIVPFLNVYYLYKSEIFSPVSGRIMFYLSFLLLLFPIVASIVLRAPE